MYFQKCHAKISSLCFNLLHFVNFQVQYGFDVISMSKILSAAPLHTVSSDQQAWSKLVKTEVRTEVDVIGGRLRATITGKLLSWIFHLMDRPDEIP